MNDSRVQLLRTTFAVNAVSTAFSGVVLLAGSVPLAPLLGVPGPLPLAVVGALFIAFGAQVWRVRREPVDLAQATAILVLDAAYVLGSVVLLLGWPGVLSFYGRLAVALLADVVFVFAILEYIGIKRARRLPVTARA
jgi:hypothetical protein